MDQSPTPPSSSSQPTPQPPASTPIYSPPSPGSDAPPAKSTWKWIAGGCGCLTLLLLLAGGGGSYWYYAAKVKESKPIPVTTQPSPPPTVATPPPYVSPSPSMAYVSPRPGGVTSVSPVPSSGVASPAAAQTPVPVQAPSPNEMPSDAGGTAEYPLNNPVFTLRLPPQWSATMGSDGALYLTTKQTVDFSLAFVSAPDVTDQRSARRLLPLVATAANKAMGCRQMKSVGKIKDLNFSEINGVINEYHGKNNKGVPIMCQYLIFTPDLSHYYTVIAISTFEANKLTVSDQSAIVSSIRAK